MQYCNTKALAYSFTLWVANTLVHGSLNDEAAPISCAQTSSKIKTRTKTACPIQTSTLLRSKPVRPPVSNADSSVITVDYNPDSVSIHRLNPSNQHKADILHIWSWSNERLGARFTVSSVVLLFNPSPDIFNEQRALERSSTASASK